MKRNRSAGGYDPELAHCQSITRQRNAKKSNKLSAKSDDLIEKGLYLGWSPASISQRMTLEKLPSNETLSHTIYRRTAKNKQQGGQLYRDLPRLGKTRWKGGQRNRNAGAKLIPGRVDIKERPAVVETRSRLGG